MVFSSIPFLFFFLPFSMGVYYLLPRKAKNIVLLLFSLIFYAWGEPVYIILMIFSSVVDYVNGIMIEKYPNKKKWFMIFSVIVNISLLGFFKYSDFLIANINQLFHFNIPLLELGLPIGISFFTFQTMSYSIDVYRKEVRAEKNFLTFMTYVSMFPQLIAGPIVRYETVSKELHEREITFQKFTSGFCRFLIGLFKKVLIANQIGLLFQLIIESNHISVLTAWLGLVSFALQIYFDFSGYSDMAIGMGKMFGFTYLENFNYPYIATSITDFWRRWHISLSSWFRDYVYIPLGGSRVKKILHIRNILIVWILTGFWHGASWNFLLWGLYFGIVLILEKFVFKMWLEKLPKIWRHVYAIFLILIGWLIFAFENMSSMVAYAKMLFGIGVPFIDTEFLFYLSNYAVIIIVAILFSMPLYQKLIVYYSKLRNRYVKFTMSTVTIVVYILLFLLTTTFLVADTYNPFLYFRF